MPKLPDLEGLAIFEGRENALVRTGGDRVEPLEGHSF